MKLTNLVTTLALIVGASTSTSFADTDCTGPFASAMNDDCHGTPPPPPPPPQCGYSEITLTAQQVFPELAANLQRAAADLQAMRRQLELAARRHERADALLRRMSEIERYRDDTQRYLSRIGTQVVRTQGCMDLRRSINVVRAKFGAPPL